MSVTEYQDVARKRIKPEPQSEPDERERKPLAIQVRGGIEWKRWVEKLSTYDERPVAMLVERALREYAEKIGFPETPPKR